MELHGTGGSDIYEIALRRAGSDQPVNCVLGAACKGICCEEASPPGPGPVQTSGPNGSGGPVIKMGCPRPGLPSRSTLFVRVGRMARVASVMRTARPGLDPMTRYTVLFMYPARMAQWPLQRGQLGPGVKDG